MNKFKNLLNKFNIGISHLDINACITDYLNVVIRVGRFTDASGQGRGERGRVWHVRLREWKCGECTSDARAWRMRRARMSRAAAGGAIRAFHHPPGTPTQPDPDSSSTLSAIDIAWSFVGLSILDEVSCLLLQKR